MGPQQHSRREGVSGCDGAGGGRHRRPQDTRGANAVAPPLLSAKPAWYAEAERLKGTRETPGAKSNPVIMSWARRIGGWVAGFYRADSTPWCGLFVAHLIGATLTDERLPKNPLSALAWRDFGVELLKGTPGAVLVFKRPGGGHVGLYAGEDAQAYHVLGGNQSDQVNICRVAKSRCVAIRWPATAPLPTGGGVTLAATGGLSTNEA